LRSAVDLPLPEASTHVPNDLQPKTLQNIAMAISAYERTLLTPSPFDTYLAGNQEALSPSARAGLAKFINTGCVACHNGVGGGAHQKFGVVEDSDTNSMSVWHNALRYRNILD